MPIWRHGFDVTVQTVTLPIAGLIGYALMLWQRRRATRTAHPLGGGRDLLAALAAALLCWQTRAGPAAQLLSIPGATALAWAAIAWLMGRRSMLVRVFGVVAAFLVISGTASFRSPAGPTRRSARGARRSTAPTTAARRSTRWRRSTASRPAWC